MRRIVVDDTSALIQYSNGGWSAADVGALNRLGNFGPVYRGTTHQTSTDGAQLRFPFTGTSVAAFGTISVSKLPDGTYDPRWECVVDGKSVTMGDATFAYAENNWPLCHADSLPAGQHELTITVHSKGRPFYVDNIYYEPLQDGSSVDGAVVEYTSKDPSVGYGSGWQGWGTQTVTTTAGSQVTLDFHGTEVSLFGYVPQELAHDATTAAYTIDGGPATSFGLAGLAAGSTTTVYNVAILSVTGLSPANHKLVVTYNGDRSHTPASRRLILCHQLCSTTPSAPSGSTLPPAPSIPRAGIIGPSSQNFVFSATADAARSSGSPAVFAAAKSSPLAAILGGVIGALFLLALAVFLLFFCRRRRRRMASEAHGSRPDAFIRPDPFMHQRETATLVGSAPGNKGLQPLRRFGDVSPSQTPISSDFNTRSETPSTPEADDPFNPPAATSTTPAPAAHRQMRVHQSPPSSKAHSGYTSNTTYSQNYTQPRAQRKLPPAPPPAVQQHLDSGVRYPYDAASVLDVPPGYSPH
ncbi:hypothetical protein MIND_00571400 [Mycena indigotica]|uniref:Transmembrane protein n=1 Tax=Mycena indigotica TaxID=2126181 RepID=A0A8H6SQN1_9AGAR|nr:uncharacterized protein MIND_00571400 [Mycena indigotica]KAF7303428.1 hypothetical protein MIND_00571400 [Mycena indigotica]